MAICSERAVSLAFHVCCFYFSAVLTVGVSLCLCVNVFWFYSDESPDPFPKRDDLNARRNKTIGLIKGLLQNRKKRDTAQWAVRAKPYRTSNNLHFDTGIWFFFAGGKEMHFLNKSFIESFRLIS